jgi:hypothetical protein
MVFPIQTSKDSWPMALRPIAMQFELFKVTNIQTNRWVIDNELVFFTKVIPWTNTQNDISNQRCEKNIGHCVMNIKMSFLWKR